MGFTRNHFLNMLGGSDIVPHSEVHETQIILISGQRLIRLYGK
jgi:hypothetical protein